ncbi:MAG: hypothetical protein OXI27_07075 [Thaumarchaeota archaeon]|nr:hypothetical protein [Nitrososphaerota archaeon]MDE0526336.1 hypothetical protein [Nitrososphaerota archaeon]
MALPAGPAEDEMTNGENFTSVWNENVAMLYVHGPPDLDQLARALNILYKKGFDVKTTSGNLGASASHFIIFLQKPRNP